MLMRSELTDEWHILGLQNRILEIMYDIHKICLKNNIEYVIAGGTLLGAIRHKGFIPWDDDLDIYMTYTEFVKLKNVLLVEYTNKYFVQESKIGDYTYFAKVRANNTTYIEPLFKNEKNYHHGIYIDIFIIHPVSNYLFIRFAQYLAGKYITLCSLAERNYKKGIIVNAVIALIKYSPQSILKPFAVRLLFKNDQKNTKYVGNLTDRLKFKNCIYNSDIIKERKLIDYENIKLYAPRDAISVLTKEFGDFMTPPSLNDIKRMQHAEIWDVNECYKKYIDKEL